MMYSCFDPRSGMYDYFSDGEAGIPINGDLPTPRLPTATKLGVAAIEVGRPMPSSAKRVGQGWRARGQIVQCGKGFDGLGLDASLDDVTTWFKETGWKWFLASAAGVAAVYYLRRM